MIFKSRLSKEINTQLQSNYTTIIAKPISNHIPHIKTKVKESNYTKYIVTSPSLS